MPIRPDPLPGRIDKKAGSRVRPLERNPTHKIQRCGKRQVPNIAAKDSSRGSPARAPRGLGRKYDLRLHQDTLEVMAREDDD